MKPTKIKWNVMWKTLYPYIAPYKWGYITAILMVFITTLTLAVAPSVEGSITSGLIEDVMQQRSVRFDFIFETLVILLALYMIKTVSQILEIFCLTNAIQNAMYDLRNALQQKIQRLPVRYFDNHKYGDILSIITNDVDTMSNALQQSFMNILQGILTLCMAIVMMWRINAQMALIAMMLVPLALLITQWIVHRSQKKFNAQQDALGRLNGTITELYGGFHEILLYNRQKQAISDFKKVNSELQSNAFQAQFMSSMISPLISLCTYLIIGTIALIGSIYAISKTILVGELQAFIRYIWQVNDPLSQVSNLSAQLQSAFAAMRRIVILLEEAEEIAEA